MGNQSTDWLRAFCRDTYGVKARVWTRVYSPWVHMGHCTKDQSRRLRLWPNSIQHKWRWRLTELFMLSSSLPNIHPLDKGLPSLSLHALLAQLDINTLRPASSQSTLSLKKDELRARTDPFARFTGKTYCPHPRSNACVPHLRKIFVWPGYQKCGMISTSTVVMFPWSFSNSGEAWGLIPTFSHLF